MKQSNKKLFVSDLDGTLLKIGDDYSAGVSDDNLKAVRDYVSKGNIFAIASARHDYLNEISPILGFEPVFIGGNGTITVVDGVRKEMYLDSDMYKLVLEYCLDNGIDGTVMFSGIINTFISDYRHYPFSGLYPKRPQDDFKQIELYKDTGETCIGVSVFVNPKDMEKCREGLKKYLVDKAEVVSSDTDFVNINPLHCTKGDAVLRLMSELKIDAENVGVIGDSDNDISMMDAVKNSFVMSHAEDDVRIHAKYTVDSVKEALDIFTR